MRKLRWMFAWAWTIGAVLVLTGCGPIKPPGPPNPPPEKPPEPQCVEGQTYGCYHNPGSGWVYACPVYDETGNVVEVKNEPTPATCPTKPTTPPPPPPGCMLAGEPTVPAPAQLNTLGNEVNTAMLALRPDCSVGGTCLLGDMTQQEWQAAVEAKLREGGLCAGQHTPRTDEIAVAKKASEPWQGFHVFVGDDSSGPVPPGGARRTVKWSPAAYSGSWLPPGEVAPPVSPPQPTGCPAEPCPPKTFEDGKPHWSWNAKTHTMGNCDSTPVVRKAWDYCKRVGLGWMDEAQTIPRGDCPVRPDGHPERAAVEAWLLGGGAVRDGRNGQDCTPNNTTNPMAFLCGTGNCRNCNAEKTVCSEWF